MSKVQNLIVTKNCSIQRKGGKRNKPIYPYLPQEKLVVARNIMELPK
jgi:hypothetical protein